MVYLNDDYEAEKQRAKLERRKPLSKHQFARWPHKASGTLIRQLPTEVAKANYKNFQLLALFALAFHLGVSYTDKSNKPMTSSALISVITDHYEGKEVTKGVNYYGSHSEMKAHHFAASDVTSGLKQSNVARMNGGKTHMFRLFKEVAESKPYVDLAKEKIMFLPVASGSSSLTMAGAELGIHDVDRRSAECALKGVLQAGMNLLLDPRDEFRTHKTVKGLRQGDNRRGVTCYHTDISQGMEIEPIQGSLRAMSREEQEGILRRHWGEHTFTQWQKTDQYQDWANNERRFNNHWRSNSSTNQPDVKFTRRTKSMNNAYSSDESEDESSDEELDTKPSSLSRGGHRSFNPKSMNNAYSSDESEDESSSSGEESSGTKPSFVKKTLPRGKRFRLESDDESSSSDEESSGMGLPCSKKRTASPYKTSEDEGKWSCKHCTYENDPSVKICAMCDQ